MKNLINALLVLALSGCTIVQDPPTVVVIENPAPPPPPAAMPNTPLPPIVRPLQDLPANKLGSSAPLHLGDRNIALLEARSRGVDAEALTITTGLEWNGANGAELGNNTADVVGTVSWGIGGANFSADFDFVHGGSFSVIANYVRVAVRYDGVVVVPATPTIEFQASAAIAYGPSGGVAHRTLNLGLIPANTVSDPIPVPPFARRFNLAAYSAPAVLAGTPPAFQIWLQDAAGTNGMYEYTTFSNTAGQNSDQYTLPNYVGPAGFLRIFNTDPANAWITSIVFELEL